MCSQWSSKIRKTDFNLFFDDKLRNYDVTWWFFVKTDITTEFSVVDLVETDSYSPVSSKFENQSRMCFDQIHIKPTLYRRRKIDLLISLLTAVHWIYKPVISNVNHKMTESNLDFYLEEISESTHTLTVALILNKSFKSNIHG